MYDLIIIWWGASGLMCSIFAPKSFNKIILESNENLWTKILLSWWERCNFTNINFDVDSCYFGLEKNWLKESFQKFSNKDMIEFLNKNWIDSQVEDNGRVLLKSWNSRQLLEMLVKKSIDNNTQHILGQMVTDVEPIEWWWEVSTQDTKYQTKNLVISTWGRSFPKTWTQWFWYQIAKKLDINLVLPYKWLCSFITKKDFSPISWIATKVEIILKDKDVSIYQETGNILFTHFGVTGPVIFNLSLAIWNYLRKNNIDNTQIHDYLRTNLILDIKFLDENLPKRLKEFFKLYWWKNLINLSLDDWKSWNEAKVTGWWVELSQLDNFFQSKKHKWLFFIWEVVDITWKTWWFNLQFAWTSGYICWKSF